ncbi:hypothetical protein F4778DRAFT_728850 [Xylariomycetidae sp. FL2044]|nr:hypothetical protein F4778DRAFT_728850 [Xylariomycetidae sp. FL2044]
MQMATNTSPWPGVRQVKTCTECKQSKLRCDSKERFPHPCTRCEARNLNCTVDPSFRRTPARKRIEAMSKELQELRSQRGQTARAPSSTVSTESYNSPEDSSRIIPIEDDFTFTPGTLQLGGAMVNPISAVEAFKIFATYFRPQYPVIGSLSISEVCHTSPFLFWTIIAIVSSHTFVPSDRNLYNRLHGPYDDLVKSELLNAPLPLHKIQASSLLCHWPMPVGKQSKDPTWLYCGVVINSALFMGLHKPGVPPSIRGIGVATGSAEARIRTWLGCFCISTALGMHLGLPPMVNTSSDLATIRQFLAENLLPPEFSLQVRLQVILAGFTNILLNDTNDIIVDSSVVQLLESELDTMKTSYPDGWTPLTDFYVLAVKLHVYALVVTRSRAGGPPRDIMLKSALSAALRIVQMANARFQYDGLDTAQEFSQAQRQRMLPKNYYRSVAFATAFLLRFFTLNQHATADEQHLAANHVIMAHTIFRSIAVSEDDEYARVARLFETLGRRQASASLDSDIFTSNIPPMRVSILIDAITTVSTERGGGEPSPEVQNPQVHDRPDIYSTYNGGGGDGQQIDYINTSTPQCLEPWPLDLATSSEVWTEPVWDLFNLGSMMPAQTGPYPTGQ